jgi:hypothetical protein
MSDEFERLARLVRKAHALDHLRGRTHGNCEPFQICRCCVAIQNGWCYLNDPDLFEKRLWACPVDGGRA